MLGRGAPDLGGRRDAVEPGHLDVEQGHVGVVLEDGGYDGVTGADLGDHLEVGLEGEQRGQRAADQRLVVGEQEPDGHGTHHGQREAGGELPGDHGGADVGGPLAQPGQARALAAWGVGRGAVVAHLGAGRRSSRTSQRRAPECRITLVTPSRTVQANSSRSSDGTSSVEFGRSASISAAPERDPRPDQLAGERDVAVALDRAAYVGERVAAEPLEVGDLGAGPVDVDVEELLGELGLDRDDRERVAEDVVQVAGEAGALVVDGEAGVLELGVDEVDVAGHHGA